MIRQDGFRLPKEWVQKYLPNFAKCGPIVTKFCTMIEEALVYLQLKVWVLN